ncbi:MAG TPA: hypothetical protein VNT75_26810 [Symbiobacteriaceae bacterium]|nr:hypothetical protein [Symbiobacteriaceae bacterium]
MRQVIQDGLNLAEQLASLPFKAARQAFQGTDLTQRPLGDVVRESLQIGEGLARLPFKAAGALLTEKPDGPSLEQRVAELEKRLGVEPPPAETPPAG